MYEFKEFYIRDQMMESIKGYIEHRQPVGGFLTEVITNNLRGAIIRADDENLLNLPAFIDYFYNEAPSECWGSVEAMHKWLRGGKDESNK